MSRELDNSRAHEAIDQLHLRLPCRFYSITYEVSERCNMPLVAEHLLRLLRALKSVSDSDICEFFGFRMDETQYVIKQLEEDKSVNYHEGMVSITSIGSSKFSQSKEGVPVIFKVECYTHDFCFNLISREPVTHNSITRYERSLPELKISDEYKTNSDLDGVSDSFEKKFEWCLDNLRIKKESKPLHAVPKWEWKSRLYSILKVEIGTIVSCLVPVIVEQRAKFAGVDVDVSEWTPRIEVDSEITGIKNIKECCISTIDNVTLNGSSNGQRGQDFLKECSPNSHGQFFGDDEFDMIEYWQHCASYGELQEDRSTAMTFGTFWLERNRNKLLSAFDFTEGIGKCRELLWLKPDISMCGRSMWGRSTEFAKLHEELCNRMSMAMDSGQPKSYLFSPGENNDLQWEFAELFSRAVDLESSPAPSDFELLVIPGKFFAANLYIPMEDSGYPVAFGLISYDQVLLRKVSNWPIYKMMLECARKK